MANNAIFQRQISIFGDDNFIANKRLTFQRQTSNEKFSNLTAISMTSNDTFNDNNDTLSAATISRAIQRQIQGNTQQFHR